MKTVLAALELSTEPAAILEETALLAEACGARVFLLHVEPPQPDFVGYEPGPQYVRDQVALQAQQHLDQLHTHRDFLRARGLEAESLLIQGPTVEKILDEALRLNCTYMVVGSRGRGLLHDLIWGSVSEGVLRKAPCPVLVVPGPSS